MIHDPANSAWWVQADCPNCGRAQFLVIAAHGTKLGTSAARPTEELAYLRCAKCRAGIVVNNGVVAPAAMPFRAIRGLEASVAEAWTEVRAVLAVRAWTAGVMLCRKIILHVAVANELPAKDKAGRAPSFDQAVKHLVTAGLITPPMKPWVDHIRKVGNGANHELDPITPESAGRVATFTEQLLILAYEMPAVMQEALPVPRAEESDADQDGDGVAMTI